MGQRVNYIVKEGDKQSIHYHHWRAYHIEADLYIGEKRFLEFVSECRLDDEILDVLWIEGCVIIDKNTKSLFFWQLESTRDTSVIDYYLKQLSRKWVGWKLYILKNRMYDAEKILAIDYIAKQEPKALKRPSAEDIIADKVEEWVTASVILKQGSSLFATKTGNLSVKDIVSYGQDIVSLIKNKPACDLPKERDEGTDECVLIDQGNKKLFVNESIFGLAEAWKQFWPDYELVMGDFGYIGTLRLAGVETSALVLSEEEVKTQFEAMIKTNDRFNPFEIAEKLKKDHADIQFNPNFFDNVKPKKSLFERLKGSIARLYRQK